MPKKQILILVTREEDLPADKIPKGLRRVKEIANCEFCNERVIYNRGNYSEQQQKGFDPVLICTVCYGQGEHMRQRYGTL